MAKYITYISGFGTKTGVIFSKIENHSNVAASLGLTQDEIIGAGFCEIADGKIIAYGKSISLGVESSENDDDILTAIFK